MPVRLNGQRAWQVILPTPLTALSGHIHEYCVCWSLTGDHAFRKVRRGELGKAGREASR